VVVEELVLLLAWQLVLRQAFVSMQRPVEA
jgi:hypothetical protein